MGENPFHIFLSIFILFFLRWGSLSLLVHVIYYECVCVYKYKSALRLFDLKGEGS